MSFAAAMFIALVLDAMIGWPKPLYRAIGHPVTWLGGLIAAGESRLNQGNAQARQVKGAALALVAILLAAGVAWACSSAFSKVA